MGKQSRGTLPKDAVEHLKNWLFLHFQHPYPSEEEKAQLAEETSLTLVQVNNWFINARRRLWKPIIEKQTQKDAKYSETVEEGRSNKLENQETATSEDMQIKEETIATSLDPILSFVDKATDRENSLKICDVIHLYASNITNFKERIERAEREMVYVLEKSRKVSPEYRKKTLFERWNQRDNNPLSIEGMNKVNGCRDKYSYPSITGMDYAHIILSDIYHTECQNQPETIQPIPTILPPELSTTRREVKFIEHNFNKKRNKY